MVLGINPCYQVGTRHALALLPETLSMMPTAGFITNTFNEKATAGCAPKDASPRGPGSLMFFPMLLRRKGEMPSVL